MLMITMKPDVNNNADDNDNYNDDIFNDIDYMYGIVCI